MPEKTTGRPRQSRGNFNRRTEKPKSKKEIEEMREERIQVQQIRDLEEFIKKLEADKKQAIKLFDLRKEKLKEE